MRRRSPRAEPSVRNTPFACSPERKPYTRSERPPPSSEVASRDPGARERSAPILPSPHGPSPAPDLHQPLLNQAPDQPPWGPPKTEPVRSLGRQRPSQPGRARARNPAPNSLTLSPRPFIPTPERSSKPGRRIRPRTAPEALHAHPSVIAKPPRLTRTQTHTAARTQQD